MICYFHNKQNHNFKEPVLDCVAIYIGDDQLKYTEQEGRYTEFVGNPPCIF